MLQIEQLFVLIVVRYLSGSDFIMASSFKMQIVDTRTGQVVEFEPGLSVEVNFIDDCVNRILAKGVGFWRTEKHVSQDIRDGIEQAIQFLKVKVRP